jgi:hypothetical protein
MPALATAAAGALLVAVAFVVLYETDLRSMSRLILGQEDTCGAATSRILRRR